MKIICINKSRILKEFRAYVGLRVVDILSFLISSATAVAGHLPCTQHHDTFGGIYNEKTGLSSRALEVLGKMDLQT